MTSAKYFAAALLALAMAAPAAAQQMAPQGAPPTPEQQVDQLDELLNLEAGQRQELVSLLTEMQNGMQQQQQEAQALQQQLHAHIGPDFDEQAIRQDAARLGELTGEMAANNVLFQARMESVFTEEQRAELERQAQQREQQMRQMREQMQQQQQQQQAPQ
ncbi:hypothetical protein HOP52_05560 [Halomonas campisalis]|uniref:Uncharacterized protein n=1 Tax=Billgrantia campisalis TaxID=74661 RepID=A0ABS9P640_9GAMM|nr:hypothetical protein [Halomonas campisalis]MCG6657241.1 hypothetical protein [Halomonas campisalis]MDR5862427.1 hypothetical protein [Halomonas campisalis]